MLGVVPVSAMLLPEVVAAPADDSSIIELVSKSPADESRALSRFSALPM